MGDEKEETIAELIERRQIWLCPFCQRRATIIEILIPIDDPSRDVACPRCGCEGITPIDGAAPDLSVVAGGKK
jgi:hypothetical protein